MGGIILHACVAESQLFWEKDFGFRKWFGITANHLAAQNVVTAIEPNAVMVDYSVHTNSYRQIVGGLEKLKELDAATFDVIICHNVLEYVEDRAAVFAEFDRLLKKDGVISLVKHNHIGKIMQKAVFENKIPEAIQLIQGGKYISENFGVINEYTTENLKKYIAGRFTVKEIYGVRTFFGLQKNEFKSNNDWISSMYELESLAEEIPEFREIAFYHHIHLVRSCVK